MNASKMTSAEKNSNESLSEERNNDNNSETKQPLRNGIHDQPQIIKGGTDTTDEAAYHPDDLEDPLNAMLAKRNKKRKYRTYDNGKKNRINLSPLKSNGIRIEKIIKQKTGLTRTGLVLAVLCIILAICLLVCLILWPKTQHSKEYPVCAKPSCLRSSTAILSKLNTNESICTNFHSYSCGRWLDSNPLPKHRSEWNMKELFQFQYRQKVHELIHTMPFTTDPSSLVWKLSTAYESCVDVDSIKTDEELKNIIVSKLGGWEVLRRFSLPYWDARKTLITLYSKFSVSSFFIIDVIPDVTDSPKSIIRLKPPQLGLANRNYYSLSDNDPVIVLYKLYIKDIVQLFGATVSDAIKFGERIFHYEKRIAEIQEDDDKAQTNYTRIAIGDLGQIILQIPLSEILVGMFPKANIKNSDYVLVSSMPYFRNLATLISYTDSTALNNYLIWRLVSEYLPYFPQKYIETMNLYKKEFSGESEPMPRWEFCISTLQKFAGFGLLSFYENSLNDKNDVNTVVSNLFSELSTVIRKGILSNRKNELQNSLLDKLNEVGIQIGLPPFMLQRKYVDAYYDSLQSDRYNFYDTVRYGFNFINEDMQRRLINPQEEYKWIDNMISNPTSVTFNSDVNKIIVPLAALQQPFFEKDYALPSLYGGIGAEIAKTITYSLWVDKSYYENGKKISPRSQEGNIDGNTLLQYLSDCILHTNLAKLNVTEKQSLISNLLGIKYAYKGLTNELSNLNIHTHQPALETFENEELFFIINMQSLCSIKSTKKENHENTYMRILTDKFLSRIISTHLTEFTNLFSCGEKSAYYESSLCRN